jgi:hypothetical protein
MKSGANVFRDTIHVLKRAQESATNPIKTLSLPNFGALTVISRVAALLSRKHRQKIRSAIAVRAAATQMPDRHPHWEASGGSAFKDIMTPTGSAVL